MVVVILISIVAGSAAASVLAWWIAAPWWAVAVSYVAGGWIGLLIGVGAVMLLPHRKRGSRVARTPSREKPRMSHSG